MVGEATIKLQTILVVSLSCKPHWSLIDPAEQIGKCIFDCEELTFSGQQHILAHIIRVENISGNIKKNATSRQGHTQKFITSRFLNKQFQIYGAQLLDYCTDLAFYQPTKDKDHEVHEDSVRANLPEESKKVRSQGTDKKPNSLLALVSCWLAREERTGVMCCDASPGLTGLLSVAIREHNQTQPTLVVSHLKTSQYY